MDQNTGGTETSKDQGHSNGGSEPKQTGKVKVVYRPKDGDPVSTTWRGRTFVKDQEVELDESVEADKGLLEAARGNPSFDVDGEDKAAARAEAARADVVAKAQAELAILEDQAHALEHTQEEEAVALERKHQADRDAFLNASEVRMVQLRQIIRGSDGSDDLHPVDDGSRVVVEPPQNPAPGSPTLPVEALPSTPAYSEPPQIGPGGAQHPVG